MNAAHDDTVDDHLRGCFDEYRLAASRWRAVVKGGRSATAEAAAERLVHARVALFEALTATGWAAPPVVQTQLERDRALVGVPDDLEALLSSHA